MTNNKKLNKRQGIDIMIRDVAGGISGCNNALLYKHRRNKFKNEQHLQKDENGNYLLPDGSTIGKEIKYPWCSGYIENISLVAGTRKILTPIPEKGDLSLISGQTFKANQEGTWILHIGSCAFPTMDISPSITFITEIVKNTQSLVFEPSLTSARVDTLAACGVSPSLTTMDRLLKDDFFVFRILHHASQSTIHNNGLIPYFHFCCIG